MVVPLERKKLKNLFIYNYSRILYIDFILILKYFIFFKSLFVAENFKAPSLSAPFLKNVSEPSRQGWTFGINSQRKDLHISIESVPPYSLNCYLFIS